MRRLLAAAGLLVVLVAPFAHAQDSNGYSGGWRDPAPTDTSTDGMPLAYLSAAKPLSGQVSHPNGIDRVDAVLVPDSERPPAGCDASMAPLTAEQSGTTVTFHLDVTFPCNLVYHVKATAKANASGPISSPPPAFQMPLDVAVAIPPASVREVTATVTAAGADRSVRLEWPPNSEPDLLGYVVTRVSDGRSKSLGQVAVNDQTRFVDENPPAGATSRYEVTAIRRGPDENVKQVPAEPTTVTVDVPRGSDTGAASGGDGSGSGSSGGLTTVVTGQASTGKPNPNLLSSVQARGGSGRPASPPTTFDGGFQEALPFDPGEQAAPPTGGDDAVVAVFDEGGDSSIFSNKPTLTFIAGGLAVLVGAGVLLYVTRRAALDSY